MSRLDSMIRRLQAQRAMLDLARDRLAAVPGVVFELGLGNGRTYDHLRETMSDREIFVFERKIAAHPTCIPDDDHLYFGELLETLGRAVSDHAGTVALVHADIGGPDPEHCARMTAMLNTEIGSALAGGGIVLSDLDVAIPGCEPLALAEGIEAGRYFAVQKTTG
ncbi:MAG: class I SAM-dependent methyltransferase [Pseudomonadota bacterium]